MKKTLILAVAFIALVDLQADAQVSHDNGPALAIPDDSCTGPNGAGGVSDTIAFTEAGTISDVDIEVAINHTWRAHLQFHVEYSVGTTGQVLLAADHDLFDDNYYAIFNDESPVPCSDTTACGGDDGVCDSASTVTNCRPDFSLSAFDGLTSPGTWTLTVCDNTPGATGVFEYWKVTVDGDGDLPVELMSFMVE